MASAQLYLQARKNSWVVERDVLLMAAIFAHDFDVGVAVP
ncbi:hypothetical protein BZL29_8514 [Mycobacterium kansasii]|uniref:Uncharacterized protein n=1 Tax=Mycobacterium kansasii TaxID=1768 RepID=A0A1V3WAP1_MYCKA|nr:hypothetical protein BZL29_8514 [Mycobacterium kansasii]